MDFSFCEPDSRSDFSQADPRVPVQDSTPTVAVRKDNLELFAAEPWQRV